MKLFGRSSGGTSFLERNQLIIGSIAGLLVLGGSAFSLMLSSGVFDDTFTVTARFSDAAGLKDGDDVQVAGLEAGRVASVDIEGGEVVVEMKINQGVEMPTDSRAEIVVETLLGKKNVTLSGGSSSQMLADGSEIPLENTRTPVELLDLANTSVRLLEESDADALETFMEEVSKVTKGKRQEITTLVNGFADTAAAIDARRSELARLIESLRILSGTFAERDDTLVSMIDNFDIVLGNLAERTNDLEALLVNTDAASHEVASLVGRNRSTIDAALRSLHKTLQIVDKHQVDLSATISYLHDSILGYQSVGYSMGVKNRWANIFVQSLGPLGVDAFAGPCGTLDQALDKLLGPDPRPCDKREEYGDQEGEGSEDPPLARERQGDEGAADDLLDQDVLPDGIGDLLDSVTGSTGLGAALRGGLLR